MKQTTLAIIALAVTAVTLTGQTGEGTRRASADSAVVVPGARYRAGSFGRLVFGAHYRDLWTAPLTVPVLHLEQYAGGLRVLSRGGSMQTKSLRFKGADGREYVFRSIDKDPSRSLPPELRGTYANRIVRDLISAEHPGGALVVARLLEAVDVLHATPQLFAMADDSLLGEYRKEFAGMLGLLEVRPTDDPDEDGSAAFAGATKVIGSEKLFERITEHADETVDARAFLAARLIDIFVGDWDRHPDQWRWARFGDGASDQWQPIPRDRDWALVKLDGLVWSLARIVYPYPQFVSFESEYPDLVWLTWNGRLQDRRFLSELDRPVWDSVAASLRGRLSDSVIDEAIATLPPALAASSNAFLRSTLISRRDRLPEAARSFYRMLAEEAEVHATDESEIVDVTRVDERFTDLAIHQRTKSGSAKARAWFRRRYDAEETRELRVYLHGGDDRVVVRGVNGGRTLVRVIGGGGRNIYVDSTAGRRQSRVRYYDANTLSETQPAMDVDHRGFVPPPTRRGWIDPPRDWGRRWRPLPWVSYTPDVGFFVGGGPELERYGFRQHPYAYRMSLSVGYALGSDRWRAEYAADVRRANSGVHVTLLARASELDIVRFYGFGNETPKPVSKSFHLVDQKTVGLEPTLHVPVAGPLTLDVGATLRRASTELDSGRFIAIVKPFGTGTLTQVGARAGLTFDSRDHFRYATRGVYASVQSTQYPAVSSGAGAYGELRSRVSTYVSAPAPLQPVLALRAGADRVWGRYPFFDAAFIGGSSTVRGWTEQRFAGDASLFGNAELRVFLTKVFLLLPADLGAFGLADGGRVYVAGEHSDAWHTGFGGGLWISFLGRANTFSIAAARSRESSGIYFRSGLLF